MLDDQTRAGGFFFSRREALRRCGTGFGALALGATLAESGLLGAEALIPRAKARFLSGPGPLSSPRRRNG